MNWNVWYCYVNCEVLGGLICGRGWFIFYDFISRVVGGKGGEEDILKGTDLGLV